MGISVHYSGRFNDPGLIIELISEMRLLAQSGGWEYTVFDDACYGVTGSDRVKPLI